MGMYSLFSYQAKREKKRVREESCNGNKIDSLSKLRWHFPFLVNSCFNYVASCDSLIPNKPDSSGQPSWVLLELQV